MPGLAVIQNLFGFDDQIKEEQQEQSGGMEAKKFKIFLKNPLAFRPYTEGDNFYIGRVCEEDDTNLDFLWPCSEAQQEQLANATIKKVMERVKEPAKQEKDFS